MLSESAWQTTGTPVSQVYAVAGMVPRGRLRHLPAGLAEAQLSTFSCPLLLERSLPSQFHAENAVAHLYCSPVHPICLSRCDEPRPEPRLGAGHGAPAVMWRTARPTSTRACQGSLGVDLSPKGRAFPAHSWKARAPSPYPTPHDLAF